MILHVLLLLQDAMCMNNYQCLQHAQHSISMSTIEGSRASDAHTTGAHILFAQEYTRPK
jgi:hypothetical protein